MDAGKACARNSNAGIAVSLSVGGAGSPSNTVARAEANLWPRPKILQ